jgi:molecular chaperone HtpG
MNLDVITFNLMKVGASFYNTPIFHSEFADFTPISRFGIGVLTCFMVSDNIEITTCQEESGFRIKMSSVQSDYLIKKLEAGNPTLQGIEPHGTRVKLELRKSIDLTNKSIFEIVRHWVILPLCSVTYHENNKVPIRIGFDKPSEALRYFYSQDESAPLRNETAFEIIESSIQDNEASYELAFAVNKSFTPERNYKLVNSSSAPSVCIEGIRASGRLPGFTSSVGGRSLDQICGLLSVRNNKKFRTTVSRMDLEQDEEYAKVAEICTKLLFNYLASEVERISNLPNQPLSQASTAGNWMYERLNTAIVLEGLREYLGRLYRELPIIVRESVKTQADKTITSRTLLSQQALEGVDTFWTIESRLVDYLGIISRDMGRELSLNDFLSTLAPDFRDPRIHTILPDARVFRYEIL